MEQKLFDSQTVVADTESNKTVLNALKIAFKEDYQKRSGKSFLRLFQVLFLTESQDHDETIEELNRWQVQSFVDRVLNY